MHKVCVGIVLAILISVLWVRCRQHVPPVSYLRKYGLQAGLERTGRELRIGNVSFSEYGEGCGRVGRHAECRRGDALGRVAAILGLELGDPPTHVHPDCPPRWVEVERRFWIAQKAIAFPPGVEGEEPCGSLCADLSVQSGLRVRLPSVEEWWLTLPKSEVPRDIWWPTGVIQLDDERISWSSLDVLPAEVLLGRAEYGRFRPAFTLQDR